MFGNLFVALLFVSLNIFFLFLTGLLRAFPSLMKYARILLREFLKLSIQLFRMILDQVVPFIFNRFGVDIRVGLWLLTFTVLLSLLLGSLIILIFGFSFSVWSLGICVLHGLLVGRVLGTPDQPSEEFHLGDNVE